MKILIAGGTSFVGRAISWVAWHHGHEVSVLNRGLTENDLPESIVRLVGDRQGDLSVLDGRAFDATIDVTSYRPSDVDRLAAALDGRGGNYLQISSISAYADPGKSGAVESECTLHDEEGLDLEGPITGATYGPLKAAAERAGSRAFSRVTLIRPTYVIGAYDATLRFPYWVERARRGGEILVPGPEDAPLAYVDARDLANFTLHCVEEELLDDFHVAGPRPAQSYVDVVRACVEHVGPEGSTVRVVEPAAVTAAGLNAKFPLWAGGERHADLNLMTLDSGKALAHGLDLRPLGDSIDDVVAWWGEREWPERWLNDDEEEVLR